MIVREGQVSVVEVPEDQSVVVDDTLATNTSHLPSISRAQESAPPVIAESGANVVRIDAIADAAQGEFDPIQSSEEHGNAPEVYTPQAPANGDEIRQNGHADGMYPQAENAGLPYDIAPENAASQVQDLWPPEPAIRPYREPVRYDGTLPYQKQLDDGRASGLYSWAPANERPAHGAIWQHEHALPPRRRWKFPLFLVMIAGAAGYGAFTEDGNRIYANASAYVFEKLDRLQDNGALVEEPVTHRAPEAPGEIARPASGAPDSRSLALPAPAAGNQGPSAASQQSADKGQDRVSPDPNMVTRQVVNADQSTTTLWWKAKPVTRFPALNQDELAAQPKPLSARSESVMAPSGRLPVVQEPAIPSPASPLPIDSEPLILPTEARPAADTAVEVKRINRLIGSFKIDEARAAIAQLLVDVPGSPSALVLSGRTSLAKAANIQALKDFESALNAEPTNGDAMIGRARALINLGRANEALEIANAVLTAAPRNTTGLWLKIEALAATGNLGDANGLCDGLEPAGALAGTGQWCRGVANKRARRPIEAESDFINALQAGDPKLVRRSQLYFRYKGYYTGDIDGFFSDEMLQSATTCAVARDCDAAGI